MIIREASCGLGRQSIKASVPHRSFLRREGAEEAHVWGSDQQGRAALQGGRHVEYALSQSTNQFKYTLGEREPCCSLDIRKAIFRNTHLPLFISRLIFPCNNTAWGGKKIKAIICQAFAIYNCKDKNQTAVISQRIELSEFTAACVIIILKQMRAGRWWRRRGGLLQTPLCLFSVLHIYLEEADLSV